MVFKIADSFLKRLKVSLAFQVFRWVIQMTTKYNTLVFKAARFFKFWWKAQSSYWTGSAPILFVLFLFTMPVHLSDYANLCFYLSHAPTNSPNIFGSVFCHLTIAFFQYF